MAVSQFTDADLHGYLDAGHSQADAARFFNVSEAAVHQRLKRMRRLTTQTVALERAGTLVEEKLSATARLERVQKVIDEEMGWAVQEARRDGGDRAALADVILKLAGEVRQQLGLQLAISKTLIDLKVVREFQQIVLDAIREESPATAQRIVERLKQRRALRPTADLPILNGDPDGDLA
jgi:hypothetical protein